MLFSGGCAELRRKFIRKKDAGKKERAYYRVEEYAEKPAKERYQQHYVIWRNWQLDMERPEFRSHMRDVTSANEALKHMYAMRDLLVEEKAKELDAQIGDMLRLIERLKKTKRGLVEDAHSRKSLEKIGRVVASRFTYKNMNSYIKDQNDNALIKER